MSNEFPSIVVEATPDKLDSIAPRKYAEIVLWLAAAIRRLDRPSIDLWGVLSEGDPNVQTADPGKRRIAYVIVVVDKNIWAICLTSLDHDDGSCTIAGHPMTLEESALPWIPV